MTHFFRFPVGKLLELGLRFSRWVRRWFIFGDCWISAGLSIFEGGIKKRKIQSLRILHSSLFEVNAIQFKSWEMQKKKCSNLQIDSFDERCVAFGYFVRTKTYFECVMEDLHRSSVYRLSRQMVDLLYLWPKFHKKR